MQEEREGVDQGDPQTLDERGENSTSDMFPAGVDGAEEPGSLILHQNQDLPGSSVDSSSVTSLQHGAWNEYAMASTFTWPQEIVGLDPFGSSLLGTNKTWHHLFTHCEYEVSARCFVNNDCSHPDLSCLCDCPDGSTFRN
jgi:hypothetical protein